MRKYLNILSRVASLDHFRRVWEALAKKGACDDWGGAEQQRVLREWIGSGCPPSVGDFIRRRANIGPEGWRPGSN